VAYHVELRRFPHNACRFNMSEGELVSEVLGPWVSEGWVSMGERDWSSRQARLTILEGPELPVSQLSMGRGWRTAERQGRDVTAQMLGAARQALSAWAASGGGIQGPPAQAAPWLAGGSPAVLASAGPQTEPSSSSGQAPAAAADRRMLGDSLGLEILSALADGPSRLSLAWRLAATRLGGATPAESLALAEAAVRSLLEGGLVALCVVADLEPGPSDSVPSEDLLVGAPEPLALLAARESWSADPDASPLWLRRT
jgi:hypothetical protein